MTPTIRERVGEASLEVGARVVHGLERWVVRASEVPTTPFLDPGVFDWVADLEAKWTDIRAELDAVLEYRDALPNFQDISKDQASITNDDRWKTFIFVGYGFKAHGNCPRCPQTTALLERVPGMTTAFFSILSARKNIPEHRGPYRGVLRYHLGLKIPQPEDACGIKVGGEIRHWAEGKSLLFDDGYEHSAWNDTDDTRVVLFMDVIRPLRRPAADVNRALIKAISISPFIQDAKRRQEAWERRFEALGR